MAYTISRATLVGANLTHDAELRYAHNGNACVQFSIALNRSEKDKSGEWKDVADFYKVAYWGKTAEGVAPYLKKGQRVAVEGRLTQKKWTTPDGENKNIIEIIADSVLLIGSGEGKRDKPQSDNRRAQQYNRASSQQSSIDDSPMTDDDCPF